MAGTIEQRILVNYRADLTVVDRLLPMGFTPELVQGYSIVGICLIDLGVRPPWLPRAITLRSWNGAHRIAVTTPEGDPAVYVPRRDTNSRINAAAGGRLFPGAHSLAAITATRAGDDHHITLATRDRSTRVDVTGKVAAAIPPDSVFGSVAEVSAFFKRGSVAYSPDRSGTCLEGLELRTTNWSVEPFAISRAESTFFDDHARFPAGSITFDNALHMQQIDHTWHERPNLPLTQDRQIPFCTGAGKRGLTTTSPTTSTISATA